MLSGTLNMTVVWLAVAVVLLIIEAAVPGLISIWFALGALAAMISAVFHAPIWLQFGWFMIVSVLTLILTRPFVRKYVNSRTIRTNAQSLIGMEAVVSAAINNLQQQGQVKGAGQEWTARTEDNESTIPEGTVVTVERIEGVKLIVREKKA